MPMSQKGSPFLKISGKINLNHRKRRDELEPICPKNHGQRQEDKKDQQDEATATPRARYTPEAKKALKPIK